MCTLEIVTFTSPCFEEYRAIEIWICKIGHEIGMLRNIVGTESLPVVGEANVVWYNSTTTHNDTSTYITTEKNNRYDSTNSNNSRNIMKRYSI